MMKTYNFILSEKITGRCMVWSYVAELTVKEAKL